MGVIVYDAREMTFRRSHDEGWKECDGWSRRMEEVQCNAGGSTVKEAAGTLGLGVQWLESHCHKLTDQQCNNDSNGVKSTRKK